MQRIVVNGIRLYRAVQGCELSEIQRVGVYQISKGAAECKYFFRTELEAAAFAKKFYSIDPTQGPFTVTSAIFPRHVVPTPIPVAGEGNVYCISRTVFPFGPATIHNKMVISS